ncbi:hypothetical protein N7493_000367 [Penicillium malachiteum]|uniref:Tyrosinase copper-binding domain-containing protein n=1 Tax=Penicillium malachiteum TaxID=1324776 RepID=A0AAD6HWC6_9EURO|nr:hypothetical protein N7493_000367 [Penicillium malachiteum]
MANAVTSTGDPLFFLHHAWLGRAWWKWQLQDKENRLYQMGGSNRERDWLVSTLGLSQPNIYTTNYNGDDGGNPTTSNHVLYTHDFRANVTVGDIMDLNGPKICAEYINDRVFDYTRGW